MIDHVSIQCADLAASARFYDTVLAPLGGRRVLDFGEAIGYGTDRPCSGSDARRPGEGFRESHLAFQGARPRRCAGVLRRRGRRGRRGPARTAVWPEYHAGYFGAFVRDPDGNNVEAVHHTI